ncbi:MAG: purine-binding chemotaxis protein CheW [Myxococcaceae bacterium]|nr:purine-binding chemotaxis protein CheW [Myxococcaceae bacterium]
MSTFEQLIDQFLYRPDEPGLPSLQWLADAPRPESTGVEAPQEFLAFSLTDETYAVPIATVREIVKVPVITEVPRAPKELLGVMNLRGEVLPVYDVRARLLLAGGVQPITGPGDVPAQARIVLVKSESGDAGIITDGVEGVVRLLPSLTEPPPPGGTEKPFLAGLSRRGERLYILLDVEKVLE